MALKFKPEGCEFDSRSSRYVGTLGNSYTCALRRETPIFDIRAVVGSASEYRGLEGAL